MSSWHRTRAIVGELLRREADTLLQAIDFGAPPESPEYARRRARFIQQFIDDDNMMRNLAHRQFRMLALRWHRRAAHAAGEVITHD